MKSSCGMNQPSGLMDDMAFLAAQARASGMAGRYNTSFAPNMTIESASGQCTSFPGGCSRQFHVTAESVHDYNVNMVAPATRPNARPQTEIVSTGAYKLTGQGIYKHIDESNALVRSQGVEQSRCVPRDQGPWRPQPEFFKSYHARVENFQRGGVSARLEPQYKTACADWSKTCY